MANTSAPRPLSAQERRWRAENDMGTLVAAAQIKKDPARIAAAAKVAQEQRAALATVSRAAPRSSPKKK